MEKKSPKTEDVYIVYLYVDYLREMFIQNLRVFKSRDDAISFAKKYSSQRQSQDRYVLISGSEYDAELFNPDEELFDLYDEEIFDLYAEEERFEDKDEYEYGELVRKEEMKKKSEELKKKYEEMKKELNIKPNMLFSRIAVDKVSMQ